MKNCKKILFSPIHYIFEDSLGGSEYSWAFNIGDKLASKFNGSVVVTGIKKINKKHAYRIIEIQKKKDKIDMSFLNAIVFNVKYTIKTIQILFKNDFSILHHVLPFRIDKTYNFSFFFVKEKTKIIIGPIQAPLSISDNDRSSSDVMGMSKKGISEKAINFILRFLYRFLNFLLKYLSGKTLDRADCIIVINEVACNMLISRGVNSNKIKIIPPGVNSRYFSCSSKRKIGNRFEIITVSYLLKRKRIDQIVEAVKIISKIKTKQKISLRIIGDGPQKQKLKEAVENANLDDVVVFEGFVPNSKIVNYYQNADIFVSMSKSESWGQMYLEAMSCGLPVIASKNEGASQMIANGKSGFLIEQDDINGLVEKIIVLMENNHLRIKFGQDARREVLDKYDWDKVVIPQYVKLYNTVYE